MIIRYCLKCKHYHYYWIDCSECEICQFEKEVRLRRGKSELSKWHEF